MKKSRKFHLFLGHPVQEIETTESTRDWRRKKGKKDNHEYIYAQLILIL